MAETSGPRISKSVHTAVSSPLFDYFLQGLRFPPTSRRHACEGNWCIYIALVWVSTVGLSGPLIKGCAVQGECLSCPLSCWERLWSPVNMKWGGWKIIILLVLIDLFLNLCITHITVLILKWGGLYFEDWWWFCEQKYAIETPLLHIISLVKLVSFVTPFFLTDISRTLSTMLSEDLLY